MHAVKYISELKDFLDGDTYKDVENLEERLNEYKGLFSILVIQVR